jgi:exo-1,4-beta-D-glucosaminidase
MNLEKRGIAVTSLLLLSLLGFVSPSLAEELVLRDGWSIQSSREVPDKGSVLSTPAFQPKQWYHTTMPSTVVAALVADHVYADPYFGLNLRS